MGEFNGLLVIDKPSGITSRDAVNRAQGWFPRRTRIGHTGTLDPLATGVLVLALGVATRLTEYVQHMPKVYRAGITLGAVSDTDDADGTITPTPDAKAPGRAQLEQGLTAFVGTIDQVPPAFSAAKVSGRRAYDLARKGKEFDLEPRQVTIHGIDVIRYEYPYLEIVVRCSKGTYIRSLARDLGQALGCGGYIATLRRLAVGGFKETDALSLDADTTTARTRMLPTWRAVQKLPPIVVSESDALKLRQGQRIALPAHTDQVPEMAVLDPTGRMLAVVEMAEGWLRPIKVLGGSSEPEA